MGLHQTLLADDVVPGIMMIIGGVVAVTWIIANTMRKSAAVKHREESRREIAAYVAEGSMTPEQGEKLMNAGPVEVDDEDLQRRIADHVAKGSMTTEDAERLIRAGRSPKAG